MTVSKDGLPAGYLHAACRFIVLSVPSSKPLPTSKRLVATIVVSPGSMVKGNDVAAPSTGDMWACVAGNCAIFRAKGWRTQWEREVVAC